MGLDAVIRNTTRLGPGPRGIRAAAGLLRLGGTVAFPTETVYGLGADARRDDASAAIFAAKGRPSHNPLIVHVTDLETAERYALIAGAARRLAERFWPGPLTLVLPMRRSCGLSPVVTAGGETVALRVPALPVAEALLAEFGGPVAAPSANPSGRISPTTADHVFEGLRGRIDAVVDGGPCQVGLESTIIGFRSGRAVLLRPGGIPLEDIDSLAGPVLAAGHIDLNAPSSPGQFPSHYAPAAALRLDAQAPEPGEGWLGFGPDPIAAGHAAAIRNLSPRGDTDEAAHALFDALRSLDAVLGPAGRIAVARVPATGLGLAIRDRLMRAAAPR